MNMEFMILFNLSNNHLRNKQMIVEHLSSLSLCAASVYSLILSPHNNPLM
jgi:hypothetical protein